MDFLDQGLSQYVDSHTSPESLYLKALERETYLKVLMPRMVSGHYQGRVLSMFSKMIQPRNILEIGTYTGYSAICLAEGLPENGKLYTVDISEERNEIIKKYLEMAGISSRVELLNGNALEIIPSLNITFDLVFIDADKINYLKYYELCLPKVRPGGFLIADNVLWSGKVLQPATDEDTRAMIEFNDIVQKDKRVQNVLFPVRDGLMVIQKL